MNTGRRVWFVIGNPLRGDDGIAHQVAGLLNLSGREVHPVHQLTPELCADLENAVEVVFLDADAQVEEVLIEKVHENHQSQASWSTHQLDPSQLIAMARSLYGFSGTAYVCRIPAPDLALRIGLSPQGMTHCRSALAALVHSGLASHIL